ncbi:MAG: nuclear transport factor 2 family protein [Gammaproteobacteria bacterium]
MVKLWAWTWQDARRLQQERHMQKAVRKYLKALEANDVDKAAALFTADGWVQSPFLGRLPIRAYISKVAGASKSSHLTVHDVLVSAEGNMRAVAYYVYDWQLKDGSKVAFECADVFNFDPETGHIASVVLVYDTNLVRDVVENKYP